MGRNKHTEPKYKTVAEAMEAMGLTDQAVADDVGCSRSWLTRVRGGEKIKGMSTALRIARRLNVPVESMGDTNAA